MSTSPENAEQEDTQVVLKVILVVSLSVLCIVYFRLQLGINKLSRALDKDGDIGTDEESEDEDEDEWGMLPQHSSEEKDLLKRRIQVGEMARDLGDIWGDVGNGGIRASGVYDYLKESLKVVRTAFSPITGAKGSISKLNVNQLP
ncbi:hypothetical protein BDZ89DRAFT_1154719 [Hymenopellis radicata]|nr:hypothetical protein BDZ89DRAFT_1154719 [Hymenopellis radicata]